MYYHKSRRVDLCQFACYGMYCTGNINCEGFSYYSYLYLYPVTYITSPTCLQVYVTESCVRQSSTHSAYQTDLFVFFAKTSIFYLSPKAPIKTKISARNKGVWSDLIYCTENCCFKIKLLNFWRPENYSAELRKNWMLFLVYSKLQTEADICSFHAMYFRDLRICYATQGTTTTNFIYSSKKERKKFRLYVNIHNHLQQRQDLFFLNHECA